jgi:hypothetical protein
MMKLPYTIKEDSMSAEEILLQIFEIVDQEMLDVNKRSDANLYPSEIVTIGLMFALKGGKYRPFYRWLEANLGKWFPKLSEQSRLSRLLRDYGYYTERFLKNPSFFTIIDTYGIELIHPRREGRSPNQLGKKGLSNGRWIVGIQIAWLINSQGEVVDWSWDTANEPDNLFREVATQYDGETITLSDLGFRKTDAPQQNLKYCEKGTWNERFQIETDFSFIEGVCHSKKLYHRDEKHLEARLGYIAALLNVLLVITGGVFSFTEFVL